MNITEFLLARIEEDERRLDLPEWDEIECARSPGWGTRNECPLCDQYLYPGTEGSTEDGWYAHVDRSHGRILAECSSKREILVVHPMVMTKDTDLEGDYPWDDVPACDNCRGDEDDEWYREPYPCVTLKALALPYKDHSEYEPEWAL